MCHTLPAISDFIIKTFFWLCWVFVAAWGFSLVAASGSYSLVAVHGLFIAVASLVVEHRLSGAWASGVVALGLRSCSSPAVEHGLNSFDAGA